MKSVAGVAILCVMAGAALSAQAPSQSQPTSQQQMMGYFVGDWKLTGTTKVSPSGPPVPFHSTEHGEWVPGGYFVEIHSVSHGPMGNVHGVRMMEYNPTDRVYTYNAYNSLGEHQVAVGNVQGTVWVWNADEKMNGVTTKGRYTVTLDSPTSYSFKSEVQVPGGAWTTVTKGKATRVPSQ